MTLNQLVDEVYTGAGEPPDLEYRDPATLVPVTTSANWLKLVQLVNEAQGTVAMWTHGSGRRMRLRLTEDSARLVTLRVTRTIADVTGNMITLTTNSGVRDTYRNWMIENAAGVSALVFMSYSSGAADLLMISEASGTFVTGNTVTLISRYYAFSDISTVPLATQPFTAGSIYADYSYGKPLEITGVMGTDGVELALEPESEKLSVSGASSGKPSSYIKTHLGLKFSTYPDDTYEYVVRFMRLPKDFLVTDGTNESELPSQFHRALVLYCLWWLFMRAHEVDKAYAVRRNFEDMLVRTQTEYDLQDRVQRGQFKLDVEG